MPLLTAEAIQALVAGHGDAGATIATMELADPSGYGRVVRDARRQRGPRGRDEGGRRRDRGGAGDPRGQRGPVPVRRRRASHRARDADDEHRPGRGVPPGRPARAARGRPGRAGACAGRSLGRPRRQRPRGPGLRHAARPAAHRRGAPACGGDDRRSRLDPDRDRRAHRRGHDDRAVDLPAREHPHRRARIDRAADHGDRLRAGRRRRGPPQLPRGRDRRRAA